MSRFNIGFFSGRDTIFCPEKFFSNIFLKVLDKPFSLCYNIIAFYGRLAQLGEHLPYKQRVTGSSPVLSTKKIFLLISEWLGSSVG